LKIAKGSWLLGGMDEMTAFSRIIKKRVNPPVGYKITAVFWFNGGQFFDSKIGLRVPCSVFGKGRGMGIQQEPTEVTERKDRQNPAFFLLAAGHQMVTDSA
jgi:hypothetical protein